MEHVYAQALWQMVEDGMKPKEAVSKLAAVLERHGRAQLFPRIARAFARIAARESGKDTVTLTVANPKDERSARRSTKEFLREMHVSAEDVLLKTDETLIGGWRLEGKENLVDASFKKHLLSLYNRATS